MTQIVGLGGGIGASRLWRTLTARIAQRDLTLVVNTGDDLWLHGLRVCPDVDTTLYALSERQDTERGWGKRDESWRCMEELRELGEDVWFQLGDRDLATQLWRSTKLRDGFGLASVTTAMATALGVSARVLPMTEDEVATYVDTTEYGRIHYEEYLVRYGAKPAVRDVVHRGSDRARPTAGVLDAIMFADVVVLAPSNPVASLGPILGLPGVRDALRSTPAPVIAISPIVCGRAITDPGEARRATSRAALMRTLGMPHDPAGVAAMYRDVCDRFVLDVTDRDHSPALHALGIEIAFAHTLPHTGAPPESLCEVILGAATTTHS